MTVQPHDLHLLDEQQHRIYDRLKKAGDGPAAFFLDACRMVRLEPSLETTTHLVGHCLREIESALRDLLVPLSRDPHKDTTNEQLVEIRQILAAAGIPDDDPRSLRWQEIAVEEGGENHKNEIRTILAAVGIAESDEVAVNWLKLAGAKKVLRLHDRAHRSGLSARPIDEEFREFWAQVQVVLAAVLERFEARYLVYIEILKRLLEKNEPTVEDVATLKNEIPRALVTYRYFFERLESPRWFATLRRKGFFTSPSAGYWPQSVYLHKIAKALPDEVLDVMLSAVTDGVWTHMEFAEAAAELPSALMARWAHHEARWVEAQRQIGWTLPQKYGDVIAALVIAGEVDAAMQLLRSLLSTPSGAETASVFDEPGSRLEWMDVQHLMQQVIPPLAAHAPRVALQTYAELLASIIRGTYHDVAHAYDGSTLWRESIAQDRGLHVGRRNELVTGVWIMALAAIETGAATSTEIVTALKEQKLPIFDRLALYVLAQFPGDAPEVVASELLSDWDRLRDDFDRREFGILLARGFPHLARDDQRRIVDLIDSGPDVDAFRERAESRGFVVTDMHIRRHVLQWQTRFVETILEHAPEDLKQRYGAWKNELPIVSAALEPPPAALSPEQLRTMAPAEVLERLRTLSLSQPTTEARFDLGHELQRAVAAAAEEYSRVADDVRDLEPNLVHWFLYGLSQGVSQRRDIDWASVMTLLEFVVAQPLEPTAFFENSWAAVRKWAASMLERALAPDEPAIPRDLAHRLWSVLTSLLRTDDGNETVEISPSLTTTASEALMQASRATRGDALDALCHALLWMRRTDTSALQTEAITELSALLDSDPTLVIRAALGKNLLYLLEIDEAWFRTSLDRLLPRSDEDMPAWACAWSGFLSRWRPSADTFNLLREHYSLSIPRLLAGGPADSFITQKIAHHLMNEYWSGLLTLEDPLIVEFFRNAPGRLRGHALWYVLRGVDDFGAVLPHNVRDRIVALWSWRVAAAADQEDRADELSWYGFFFALGQFDDDWSVATLNTILKLGVALDHHGMTRRLAAYAASNADLAFECFQRLISLDERRLLVDEDSAREIVRHALQSPNSRENARAFVNRLASEGQFQFADLVG